VWRTRLSGCCCVGASSGARAASAAAGGSPAREPAWSPDVTGALQAAGLRALGSAGRARGGARLRRSSAGARLRSYRTTERLWLVMAHSSAARGAGAARRAGQRAPAPWAQPRALSGQAPAFGRLCGPATGQLRYVRAGASRVWRWQSHEQDGGFGSGGPVLRSASCPAGKVLRVMGFRVFSLNTVQFGVGRCEPFGAPTPTGSQPAMLGSEGWAWAASGWAGGPGSGGR